LEGAVRPAIYEISLTVKIKMINGHEMMTTKNKTRLLIFFIVFILATSIYLIPKYSPRYQTFRQIKQSIEESKNQIQIYVNRVEGNKEEPLKDGALIKDGEILHIGYYSEKPHYGLFFSIDGSGKIVLHYPRVVSNQDPLVSGEKTFFDFTHIAGNGPFFETIYFATSPEVIDAYSAVNNLQRQLDEEKILHPQKEFIGLAVRSNMVSITLKKKRDL
jgi:hypothetical protein